MVWEGGRGIQDYLNLSSYFLEEERGKRTGRLPIIILLYYYIIIRVGIERIRSSHDAENKDGITLDCLGVHSSISHGKSSHTQKKSRGEIPYLVFSLKKGR